LRFDHSLLIFFREESLKRIIKIATLAICFLIMLGCENQFNNKFQGYLEGKYTYLSAPSGGQLNQLLVTKGAVVELGQTVFVLDSEPEASRLEQARGQVVNAQRILDDSKKGARQEVIDQLEARKKQTIASLDYSKKTLMRYQALQRKAAIDKSTLDQAQSDYDERVEALKEIEANIRDAKLGSREDLIAAYQAQVSAAQAAASAADWALVQKTVIAPVKARVFDTFYEPGEYVIGGKAVVALLPDDKLKIVFFAPEYKLGQFKMGQKVVFNCDGCSKNNLANISYVSPQAEYTPPVIYSRESKDKLVFRIEAQVDPLIARGFNPGQPVEVTILPDAK
jgi:HlyD family secretion protein